MWCLLNLYSILLFSINLILLAWRKRCYWPSHYATTSSRVDTATEGIHLSDLYSKRCFFKYLLKNIFCYSLNIKLPVDSMYQPLRLKSYPFPLLYTTTKSGLNLLEVKSGEWCFGHTILHHRTKNKVGLVQSHIIIPKPAIFSVWSLEWLHVLHVHAYRFRCLWYNSLLFYLSFITMNTTNCLK